jgi:serine/threonine-protein kinase
LQHPNIVQTHKVGCAGGRHFIAMEYLEGQPLHRALPRLRAPGCGLDPLVAARIVADALAGLAYAHDAVNYDGTPLALVHRDVSPHNLFLTYDGQVKLLDFGVAKVAAAALDLHTPAGMIKGKLGYIAPEQAHGRADRRSDVWSAGVVLWEMLSGARLFKGDDAAAKLRAALGDEIPDLRSLRPELSETLAQIVTRALERDLDQRFENAAQMKSELEAWLVIEQEKDSIVVAPDAVARASLATVMQSRFAGEIRERRAGVLECFAAVDDETRWREVTESGPRPMRPSTPYEEPRAVARKQRWTRAGVALLALGLASLLVVALGSKSPVAPQVAAHGPEKSAAPAAAVAASTPSPVTIPSVPEPVASERPVAAAPNTPAAENAPAPSITAAVAHTRRASSERHNPPAAAVTESRTSSPEQIASAAPAHTTRSPAQDGPAAGATPDLANPRGRLRLEATPYAVVSLAGKRLGITPIDVELPAAAHTLTLRNPERGIETTYRVEVVAGESLLRRVVLE